MLIIYVFNQILSIDRKIEIFLATYGIKKIFENAVVQIWEVVSIDS